MPTAAPPGAWGKESWIAEEATSQTPREQIAGLEHRELEDRIGSAVHRFWTMAVQHGEMRPSTLVVTARVGGRKPPAWLKPTLATLSRLSLLREDWDSYGAPAIQAGTVTAALTFLFDVALPDTPPPAIVPTGAGALQLEWRADDVEIDVEISPEGWFDAVYEGPDGELEWQGDVLGGVAPELSRRIAALPARKTASR